MAGVCRFGDGAVGFRYGEEGMVKWTLGGVGVAAGVGRPFGIRGTSPSSLVMMSVQLLIGRSWLGGRAEKDGSRRFARMVTACMAQRWRAASALEGDWGEQGEAFGEEDRSLLTVGCRSAIRCS